MKINVLTVFMMITFLSFPAFAQTGGREPQSQNHPVQSQPQTKTQLWALTCWQNGIEIISEHAMTNFTYGTNSFSATLQKDGKIYVSGLDQNSGTVCQVLKYQR